MNLQPLPTVERPTRVRYGVLGFACSLSMITYLDRVCFGTVAPQIQREFGLTDTEKGMLFSAFALAYAAFEVPSGWLGDVFGPRRTLIRIVLWWSVFTALTGIIFPSQTWPQLAFLCLLAVRFFFGMGEAGCYPNISRAFHNWFPFGERGFAQGTVWMAGRFAGGVTTLVVLALMIETKHTPEQSVSAIGASTIGLVGTPAAGPLESASSLFPGRENLHVTTHWRHTFWIFGSLGLVWCVLFRWWFRDRPEQKAGVNDAELALIRHGETHDAAHAAVPWGKLLANANLWALCLMYFCAAYGWYFNITFLPGYLEKMYGLSKGAKWSWEFWQFSLLAGAPLLFGCVACFCGGMLTDFFIRRTGNRKWGRRLFGVIGHSTCALCYFLSVFAHNPWLFVLAIAMASFCNDLTMGSAWASCLDIGKKYSGIVAGCMNTVGNLGGAAAGFLTGWILDLARRLSGEPSGTPNHLGWRINLCIFGAVYLVATFLWFRFDATKPVVPEGELDHV
jgi:ACS family glucarate transporter-like MFS transporter